MCQLHDTCMSKHASNIFSSSYGKLYSNLIATPSVYHVIKKYIFLSNISFLQNNVIIISLLKKVEFLIF